MDDDVEMIKKMILEQIKPINFGDELNLEDILGSTLEQVEPIDTPNLTVAPEENSNHFKPVENVVCHVCFKIFSNTRYFRKHFSKHTGRFSCKSCKKIFSRKETQLKHITRCKRTRDQVKNPKKVPENAGKSGKYYCEKCCKNFTRRENYDQHIMVHNGVQVICNTCQKKLSSFKSYQRHRKIHEDQKHKIACQDCPSEFSLKSNLQRHVRLYQHKNRKICQKCNKNVKTNKNLLKHRSQDAISTCSICSEVFCLERDFKSHLKKDHTNLWFKCKECTNTPFMTRSGINLQEHVKKHHSIELQGNELFKEGWFMIISN